MKDVAQDFLRFMATDYACDKVFEETKGSGLFDRNIKEINPANFNSLCLFEKSVYNIRNNGKALYKEEYSHLSCFGGLTDFILYKGSMLNCFASSDKNSRKTAERIFEEESAYWTANNLERFKELLIKAGVI